MSSPNPHGTLARVTSIKVKLGLLVAASVLVAAVLATLGAGTVPAALSIPVTVLLALGVTQLLAVGMTSPLREMTVAARRMAAGDYAVRVHTTSTDEVGELARTFNRMAADLATVDRQRRDLVATVSHELRTPLTALVAVLENLDDGVTVADPTTIRVALGQAERLSNLVRDLLDLSRGDAGVVRLERTDIAIRGLVEECVAELRAGGRTLPVEVYVEPPGLEVRADRARLHQLLANLLDNAARHSPPGGVVRVRATSGSDAVVIEVSDQGAGIAPTDRDRAFERFGTLHDAGGGGTGLGLAIARWVSDLHGGRITLLDPRPEEPGAHFRVELPLQTPAPEPTDRERPLIMSTVAAPTATTVAPSSSILDDIFGSLWPERDLPPRRGVLAGSLAIGVFAGLALPFARIGLGTTLVLLASGGLVLWLSQHRRTPFTWACAGLATALALVPTVRAADWLVVLALLMGALLTTAALTAGRSVLGLTVGAVAWPLAGLRGMGWLGRTLRAMGGSSHSTAVLRTAVLSTLGVVVFGALFASGDAIFATWISAIVPDVRGSLVLRLFVAVAVAGIVLAAAYLALNPPTVERPVVRRPAQHRFEWLAPVLLVDVVFVMFLAAQAAAFFGGHDYVSRVTGLTYAGYVHQGFAQLTLATALTLLVVWAAARKAGGEAADRLWLRGSLGLLCALTLVVVASALHRMDLYQDAYGFTRLRLLVDLFEAWLGLVVVAVVVAGLLMRGGWLPRFALISGAALLLGLAIANPDAWIARHNLERYQATGKVDWYYLKGLSADATPTLAKLPKAQAACTLSSEVDSTVDERTDGWRGWNLGRARAAEALASRDLAGLMVCADAEVFAPAP